MRQAEGAGRDRDDATGRQYLCAGCFCVAPIDTTHPILGDGALPPPVAVGGSHDIRGTQRPPLSLYPTRFLIRSQVTALHGVPVPCPTSS